MIKKGGSPYRSPYTASPLNAPSGLTVTAQAYPVTVGAGGPAPYSCQGASGTNSVFSTITSAGGGKGGCGQKPSNPEMVGGNGGSGGGGGAGCGNGNFSTAGTGNTPSVSPSQGNNGGGAAHTYGQWAGGGGPQCPHCPTASRGPALSRSGPQTARHRCIFSTKIDFHFPFLNRHPPSKMKKILIFSP